VPHKPDKDVVFPSDPNSKIWRFLDLPKFLALLHSRSLNFARLDTLHDPDSLVR
jgi:hypothetical protein